MRRVAAGAYDTDDVGATSKDNTDGSRAGLLLCNKGPCGVISLLQVPFGVISYRLFHLTHGSTFSHKLGIHAEGDFIVHLAGGHELPVTSS